MREGRSPSGRARPLTEGLRDDREILVSLTPVKHLPVKIPQDGQGGMVGGGEPQRAVQQVEILFHEGGGEGLRVVPLQEVFDLDPGKGRPQGAVENGIGQGFFLKPQDLAGLKGFGQGLHVGAQKKVDGQLGGHTASRRTEPVEAFSQDGEGGLDERAKGFLSSGKKQKLSPGCRNDRARDRDVEVNRAPIGDETRLLFGFIRGDGGHVDDNLPWTEGGKDSLLPFENLPCRLPVAKHENDEVGLPGCPGRRFCTGKGQGGKEVVIGPVISCQGISGPEESGGHGNSHGAQTDPGDFRP